MLSLCACGSADVNNSDNTQTDAGDAPAAVDTALELLSRVSYSSVYEREDSTSTETTLIDIQWTENGLVAEGYGEDSGGHYPTRLEITLDDQKRPATLSRTTTYSGGRTEEMQAEFTYPDEYTVKLIHHRSGGDESYVIYEYNDKGYLIREEYPNYTHTYEYDDNGYLIREQTDYTDPERADRTYTTVYTYGSDGKPTFSVKTNEQTGSEVQCTYHYYPNGNLMYVTEITSDANVNTYFRAYNPKSMLGWDYGKSASGGIICTAIKDANGRIVQVDGVYEHSGKAVTATFTYDENGYLTASNGFYDTTERWEYNAQGRPVKYIREYNGVTDTTTYTYDELGRLIKEEMTATDGESRLDVREYSDAGVVTKRTETHVYSDGQISTQTMELCYVANNQCAVSKEWTDFFLTNVFSAVYG